MLDGYRVGRRVCPWRTRPTRLSRVNEWPLLGEQGPAKSRSARSRHRHLHHHWRKGWWDAYVNTVDRQFINLPWLEARADRIGNYEAMLVSGLLQTREYAETLIRNAAAADTSSR